MALNKLYYVYGLDTACLYTPEESAIEQKLSRHVAFELRSKTELPNKR